MGKPNQIDSRLIEDDLFHLTEPLCLLLVSENQLRLNYLIEAYLNFKNGQMSFLFNLILKVNIVF